MKLKQYLCAAKKILTCWDYCNLDSVFRGGYVVDFGAMTVKLVVFLFHILCVFTLPISTVVVLYISRSVEIRNLKAWVRTMRKDRGFFNDHHYIEIKKHIEECKDSYSLTLNW